MKAGAGAMALCDSQALHDGGPAVPFDVVHRGQACRAFAIRHDGRVRAFLNRCTHVAMELDWQPNRVFDASGRWLVCASHGAAFDPQSGDCVDGPCKGGLVPVQVFEQGGQVCWLPDAHTRMPAPATEN